ncbi:hypothetical protein B0H16DRAFT_1825917 [Mycena metata]|uniref:Uncharacterized protein n=1 Tax=Mycena metata TaxID=1033252 RepID=A0AAD7J465_9AGAR|nr:hypothetical protein B0H16DRAFT_1825917 [Mycena metata]
MDTIHNVSPHLLGSTEDQSTGSTLADRAMDGFLPLPHFDHGTRPRHGSFDSQIPQIRLSQFSFPSYNPDTPENEFMPRRPRSNTTLPTHIRSHSEDVYSGMHPFSSQRPSDGDSRYFHGQLLSAPGENLPSITGYGRYSVGAPSEASIYSGGGSDSQYSPYTSPSVSPQAYSTELPEDLFPPSLLRYGKRSSLLVVWGVGEEPLALPLGPPFGRERDDEKGGGRASRAAASTHQRIKPAPRAAEGSEHVAGREEGSGEARFARKPNSTTPSTTHNELGEARRRRGDPLDPHKEKRGRRRNEESEEKQRTLTAYEA